MIKNAFKDKVRAGELAYVSMVDTKDPAIVEILGRVGFDAILIESEHTARHIEQLEQMVTAADARELPTMVKLLDRSQERIQQILNVGVMGIAFAHINSAEDAAEAVRLVQYPPSGTRGYHFCVRANGFGDYGPDQFTEVASATNEAMFVCIICESVSSIEQADEIAALDGVDALMWGPGDLSMELGVPYQHTHPSVMEYYPRLRAAAERHGKALWRPLHNALDADHAMQVAGDGAQILACSHDVILLRRFYQQVLDTMREGATRPLLNTTKGADR